MSEKPQHAPGAQDAPAPDSVSRETPNERPADRRGKRSSVYVYLAVLFGAAFLMLLLAYFIQQRNNENTISGLQDNWDLSREQLVKENQRLEEECQDLLEQKEALRAQLDELQSELDGANLQYEFLTGSYEKYVGYTSILQALYDSEVKLEAGDYTGAAAVLTDINYSYFVDTIGDYDAEMEHDHPEGMFLRPRFDALVSALTQRGELDGAWAGQELEG